MARRPTRRIGLGFFAGLALLSTSEAAIITVAPGDTGTLTYPLQNISTSAVINGASLQVKQHPSFLNLTAGTAIGPADVAAGQTHDFVVPFTVAGDAPTGVYPVRLEFVAKDVDLSGFSATVMVGVGIGLTNGELNRDDTTVAVNGTSSLSTLAIDLFDASGVSSVTVTYDDYLGGATPVELDVDHGVSGATARVSPAVHLNGDSEGHTLTFKVYNGSGGEPAVNTILIGKGDTLGSGRGNFFDTQDLFGQEAFGPGVYESAVLRTGRPLKITGGGERILLYGRIDGDMFVGGPQAPKTYFYGGPTSTLSHLGLIRLEMRTGATPAEAAAAPYVTVTMRDFYEGPGAPQYGEVLTMNPLTLGKYYQTKLTIENYHASYCADSACPASCPLDQPNCHLYRNGDYEITLYGIGGTPFPNTVKRTGNFISVLKDANVPDGENVPVPLDPSAPDVIVTLPKVNRFGNMVGAYIAQQAPAGKASLPPSQALVVRNEADVQGPVELELDIGDVSLEEAAWAGMTVRRTDSAGAELPIDQVVVSSEAGFVRAFFSFSGDGDLGIFQVVYPQTQFHPVDSTLLVRGLPELSLSASAADATVTPVSPSDRRVAAPLAAAGKPLAGAIYEAKTASPSLGAGSAATFRFDSTQLAARGVAASGVRAYALDAAKGAFVRMEGQSVSVTSQTVTVSLSTPGIYALFGAPLARAVPESGPAGSAITIVGSEFGAFGDTTTVVRFGEGGPTADIVFWGNSQITVLAPALSTGSYGVLVERHVGTSTTTAAGASFTVTAVSTSNGPAILFRPFDGQAVASDTPEIVATFLSSAAVATSSVRLTLDGVDVTTSSFVSASSAAYTSHGLANGPHVITAFAADVAGSTGAAAAGFVVDTLAPQTSFYLNGAYVADSSTYALNTQLISIESFDSVSGVEDIQMLVDGDPEACSDIPYDPEAAPGTCANLFYAGPFSLSPGTHTVYYAAYDAAGNEEDLQSTTVWVSTDARAPRTTLSAGWPSRSAGGIVYATDVTPLSLAAVDDGSALGDAKGGSYRTFVGVDGAAPAEYAGAFSLSGEGGHALTYRSVDLAGNSESTKTLTVRLDLTPPVSTLEYSSGTSTLDQYGNLVITTAAVFTLTAADPVSHGVASGLGALYYVIDDDPFSPACAGVAASTSAPRGTCANQLYGGPFTLSTGAHVVYYLAEDTVGNQEDLGFTTITVEGLPFDLRAPRTTLAATPSLSSGGVRYASGVSAFTLSAVDDRNTPGDGAGVGTEKTYLALDATSYSLYTGPFQIPAQGTHTLSFYSVDHLGFAETPSTAALAIDRTPPVSTLARDGLASVFVTTYAHFSLSAQDPGSTVPVSGVSEILYATDGTTTPLAYASPFAFSAGTHSVTYYARDAVGNAEAPRTSSFTVHVDTQTPRTTLSVSAASSTVGGLFVSSGAVFSLSRADDLSAPGDGAGELAATYVSIDAGAYVPYAGGFALPATGTHTVSYYSVDWTGLAEAVHSTGATTDASAPLTILAAQGAGVMGTGGLVISSSSLVALSTSDAGSGVEFTEYAVDYGDGGEYGGPFALSAGTHTIEYRSVDRLGNEETVRSTTVAVDQAPPVSTLAFAGPARLEDGTQLISTSTLLSLTAADAPAGSAAAGIQSVYYALDGSTTPVVYAAPFSLTAGTHTVSYWAADRVANVEAARLATASVRTDSLAPRTALSVGASSSSVGGLYVSSGAVFALSAVDDLSEAEDAAGEVAATYVAAGGAGYSLYSGTFAFPTEGSRVLHWYSVDWTGRVETVHSATVTTDRTAPATSLAFDGYSTTTVTGVLVVSTEALVALSTADAASGVGLIEYGIDDGEGGEYAAPFSLAAGTHTILYRSTDRVGNVETIRSTLLDVQARPFDVLPARTQASVSGSFTIPGRLWAKGSSSATLTAADDGLAYGDAAGGGVAQILYGVDTTTLSAYSAPFAFGSEGPHVLRYRAVDAGGRYEAVRSTTVYADFSAPVTEISASPSGEEEGTLFLLAGYSPVILTPEDPDSSGASSGLALTEYAVDAGTAAAYAGPFTLTPGDHTVYYRSRDRLGNQEAWKVQVAYGVDASTNADSTNPEAAIVSLVDGSTLTALATITGTAADDILVSGLELAARDLDTGEWWDGTASSWTSSGPVYRAAALADVDSELTWSVDVGSMAAGSGFGAFSGFLVSSHTYRVYARALDFAGHESDAAEAHFVWRGATNSYVGPGQVLDLAAQTTGYRAMVVSWTAPGANGGAGRAAAYELRAATFPFNSSSFSLGRVVPTAAPQPAGSAETAAFGDAEAGRNYYFLLLTRNAGGQTSEYSNEPHAYSGDFLAALDGRGRQWQLARNQNTFNFTAYGSDGEQSGQYNDFKPSGFNAGAVGFDADGGAYAFLPVAGTAMPDKPKAVLYRSSPDGTFVSSTPYFGIGGQTSALNLAPGLALASSMDSAGKAWIAGDAGAPGQYAGLWRADEGGLNLVGLSPGATPYAVLSLAEGRVWMAGTDGELVFWRHDVASGETARYHWTNTLGGSGSAGKAVLEDVDGGVWIAGWARTATAKVAALWRWSQGSISLVASSTGTYGEGAEGLDLDGDGKFWLSGRSTASAEGTPSLALWSWQSPGGGSDLALSDRRYDVPPSADFGTGQALVVSQGRVWTLAGPSPYGARSRALQTGSAAGTAHFADGFSGGSLGFFISENAVLDGARFHGLGEAAPYGTDSAFVVEGLPAPGTYYFAVFYDQSGTLASGGGEPSGADPIGLSLAPVFVPAGGTGTIPPVVLGPDAGAPTVSVLSPVDGSTTTAALLSISGTASDDRVASDLRVGLQRLSDGKWWDGSSQAFVDGGPRMEFGTTRVGRADSYSWSSDLTGMRGALTPGVSYRVHAAVSDLSGGEASASAAVVLISSTNPTISTYGISVAMSRDAAGNFWLVGEDRKEGQPAEYVLRKYDATGLALSSVTLSGAGGEGSYGIAFDSSGNAWIAGSAEQDGETKAAVWKVAAAGATMLSSATAASAYGTAFAGGVAVDSSGNVWVPGAQSTGEGPLFRHALWKFSSAGALAAGYPKTFQRSGGTLDAALAAAIDAAGSVWSVGVSSNPATGRLDLAVWKHGSSGALAGGFPAYLPSAFASIEGEGGVQAGVAAAPSGGVWVAASRSYLPFDASDLVLLRYDASGAIVSSSVWHASGYAHASGAAVALDPAGAPFVLGSLRPAPFGSTHAVWKYSQAGALAAGYPKASALNFDGASLAVDGAGTPWVVSRSRPEVFGGGETVAGASGPGFYAAAGYSGISGMVSYPAGLAAGTPVTFAASRDGFHEEPTFAQVISTGGAGLPYSLSLLAPATWQILAFAAADPDQISTATPVGSYAGFAPVPLSVGSGVSGANFALHLDTTPPSSAITSFVSGSTLTALETIRGTASDDSALIGPMLMAARDLDAGLWWDAAKQDWVVSESTPFSRVDSDGLPGALDARRWSVRAAAESSDSNDATIGGLSDFLPYGHSFLLLEKQIDIAGNVQTAPSAATFTWRGAAGAAGPPESVDNLTVAAVYYTSATLTWTAPGEHQNIGRALSYDLRYTSATSYDFTAHFGDYAAASGMEDPGPAGFLSSHTLTGLLPGKRYRAAVKTLNHEGGLSGLSNVPPIDTLVPHVPPRTSLAAGTPSHPGSTLYVTAATTMTLVAVDDLIAVGDGIGEGVATTYVRIDTTTYSVYHGETISFSTEGVHSVVFYSVDAATNVETTVTRSVGVDLTSPSSQLSVAGSSVTGAAGLVYSTAAVFSFSSSDPASSGTASGVAAVLYAVDAGTEAAYASPFSLSSGAHTVYFRARDRVDNAESVHVETFTIQSAPFDLRPPRSILQAGPSFSSSVLYVSAVSSLGIVSVDDGLSAGDAAGHGVAQRFVAVDTTTYSLFTGTFSLVSEGTHTVSYYAVDSLGRAEVAITTTVAVDATPPVSALAVSGSSAADVAGLLYYSTAAAFSFTASDPVSAGVAAGTAAVYYAVDAGTPAAYGTPFLLSVGTHTVHYQAADRAGNLENPRSSTFTIQLTPIDVRPPRTAIVAAPSWSSGPLYAAPVSTIGFVSADDGAFPGDGAGRGVARVFVAIDTTTYSIYSGTFSLVAEGTHTVSFYAEDALGRAEAALSTTVAIDSTRPESFLAVAGSSLADAGLLIVSTDAVLTLTASDPSFGFSASGVDRIEYAVDGASTVYAGPFSLSSGTRVVAHRAVDRAGNAGVIGVSTFSVQNRPFDARPPRTTLVAGTPSYSTTTALYGAGATAFSLTAADDALTAEDGAGKGEARAYYSVDGGAYFQYSGTFSVAGEGVHQLSFYGVDVDGNREEPRSRQVGVDLTAPAASVVVTGFSAPDGLGRLLVSTVSSFTLTALDPVIAGAAAGAATVYYAIDAGTEAAYGSPFTLTAGTHTLFYRSVDRVANMEPVRVASITATVPSTATAPSAVTDLFALTTGYRTVKVTWTAPGDVLGSGRALEYDLRVATFTPAGDLFYSATRVPTPAPSTAGTFETASFAGAEPGLSYRFALRTASHAGRVSPDSNVSVAYAHAFYAAVGPDGLSWLLDDSGGGFNASSFDEAGRSERSFNDSVQWTTNGRALGFDADGGVRVFMTVAAPRAPGKPVALLYEADPRGVFVSSRPLYAVSGQQSALNEAPDPGFAAAVDGDGVVWIGGASGAPGHQAGLWKVDPEGLRLVGLSLGATVHAVSALGGGPVWMTGTDGGLVLWRHDPASGDMTRYHWTGGGGAGGRALVEDTAGRVWIAGWTVSGGVRRAALWRWTDGSISLVASSTGAYSDDAFGLDLDARGRFWLGGRSRGASGSVAHAFWTWNSVGGGASLELAGLDDGAPGELDYAVGQALALARGRAWGLARAAAGGLRSRTLGYGSLAGTASYAPGFSGGQVAFFVSLNGNFDDVAGLESLAPAPSSGSLFAFEIPDLPAPATYYIAAFYDLSGQIAETGEPGAGDPFGFSAGAVLAPGALASVGSFAITADTQAPAVEILSPLAGSTVPVSALVLSGTASDDRLVGDIRVGIESRSEGLWWDASSSAFTASGEPLLDLTVSRSGRAAVSWTADLKGLRGALRPGYSYRVLVEASDVGGHSVSASAPFVLISTTNPSISTQAYAMTMSRDAAGRFWLVSEDHKEGQPDEYVLRKYDATGLALASTTLSGAASEGAYGIAFDSSGNAWVAGSASEDDELKLAVWKVSSGGGTLLSSATFAGASGAAFSGGVAVDGSDGVWVAGAESTGDGPFFKHGLWKFTSGAALVSGYPKYFQRSGGTLDGGLAAAIDASGNIWSAGVSSNPANGRLDLAVWKHDSSGALAGGFPKYRSAAFASIEGEGGVAAAIAVSPSGAVWVAGSQSYPPFDASDLALDQYDLSGALVSSSVWHATGYSNVQAKAVALDPSGNPIVLGSLRPAPYATTEALWKYSSSGALAAGYPKASAMSFGSQALAVDGAGTAWVVSRSRPEVFHGTETVAGAPVPGYYASAAYSTVSGTITYAAGLTAGTTVTLVASADGFHGEPSFFTLAAPGGSSVPYSARLLAPATYQMFAFVGSDPDQTNPILGGYAGFVPVQLYATAPVSGASFALFLDTTPPVSAFGFASGSTFTALATIRGTASDDGALVGPMRLAAKDLDTGLWWDAAAQDWVSSTTTLYRLLASDGAPGRLDARAWSIEAGARGGAFDEPDFGGFSDFLPYGHSFVLYEKQIDFAGNEQTAPAVSSFVWRGAAGASGAPDAVGNLSVFNVFRTSASAAWTAPGEHRNIGHALSFDLRVTTETAYDFANRFSSYTAMSGLPEPPYAYQGVSFTLTGLIPGKRYRAALKTLNHEGGLSALSNIPIFDTLPDPPVLESVVPSSAPIGAPFSLTGTGFGVYSSSTARVRFGSYEAPISSWTDTAIEGTVPGALSTGSTTVIVERWDGGWVSSGSAKSFLVLLPSISTLDPVSGPVDTVVTVSGDGFGPYDGDATTLLVGGSSVAVSVWNDHEIVWTVPADLSDGEYPVVVRRSPSGGSVESSSAPFTVGSGFGGMALRASGGSQPLAVRPDKHFRGSLRLTRAAGGAVRSPVKAAVLVPAGALPEDAEVALRRVPGDPVRTAAADDLRARVVGEALEFGPEGTRFDAPVTLEIPYDPALAGAHARGTAIHYFNPLRRAWEALPTTVDEARKVLIAQTDHFSIYQPLGLAPTTAAQDEFYYRDHYAFPSPSRAGAPVVFRLQPGQADTIEVRVYDFAGRKIHESSDFTFLGAFDDGNGKGAQDTYDHSWSVSGIGSGVYQYVLKASRAGFKPIVKTGKVGVIK